MSTFLQQYNGYFNGVMRWNQWDQLISTLQANNDGNWYVYYVGETVPQLPIDSIQFNRFIQEIDNLLRNDHDEDYLGIVYADNREKPSFIKIFDPNNLGSSCGSSGLQILPGWIISREQPVDLQVAFPNPGVRRRWWQRIFSTE